MISKTVMRWLTLVALVGLSLGVMVPAASAAFVGTEIPSCPFTIASSGNFFVKKNLTSTGTCIKVLVSNVAIDMNGHTITGNGTGSGITDTGTFVRDVAISNGKIKNFGDGIDFFGFFSRVITLEKVDSSDNKEDGIFIMGSDNVIKNVRADRNGAEGIDVNSSDTQFDNVEANDNKFDGIFIGGGDSGLNRITANRNGDDGIDVDGDDDNVVANARTDHNGGDGMFFCCFDDLVMKSTASSNGKSGMFFDSADNRVSDSTANDNKAVGMDLLFGGNNEVTDVTANRNATGVILNCNGSSGNAVKVSAHGNTTKDLSEIGTCTNLLNHVGTGP